MLRKLLKYDLRANMKIYCFLWPCIVIAAILQRLLLPADLPDELHSFLIPLITMLLMFSIFGAVIGAMVVCISRFYKGLLKEEGYLMFTLPVHAWQLILSKLLVSMMTIIVTGLLSFVSVIFFADGLTDGYSIPALLMTVGEIVVDSKPSALIFLIVLTVLYQALAVLLIYLACAIGHLAKKHRIVASVGAWFGLNYGYQFAVILFGVVLGHSSPWFITLTVAALVALSFYFTHRILQKRLNLE